MMQHGHHAINASHSLSYRCIAINKLLTHALVGAIQEHGRLNSRAACGCQELVEIGRVQLLLQKANEEKGFH
eukprot:855314-Pelagomonas_calceolata.AAC.3